MFEQILIRINAFATHVIEIVKSVFIAKGKNATGQTLASLRADVTFEIDKAIELDIFGDKTFEYIEQGRRAGAKMPPEGVLLNWMQARGIPESAEYAIRKSIAQNGIEPVPIIEMAFVEIQNDFKRTLSSEILSELSGLLFKAIEKGFKFTNTSTPQ